MQRAVQMDQRRESDLLQFVRGLRFFQQLPRHLALRFVHAMSLRRVSAEALVWHASIPGQTQEEGELCIITRGAVAVYGDRAKVAAPRAAAAEAVVKAGDTVLPLHGSAGAADDGDAPARFVLPAGIAPGSEAATAAAAAAATAAAAQRRRGPRHLQSATAGSISLPAGATLNLNPATGSVSLPPGAPSPLTGLGAASEKAPEPKQFSLVLTRKASPAAALPGYEDEQLRSSPILEGNEPQRGISLVPGWVTPPSSDDDDDSDSGSESDGEGGRRAKRAGSDVEEGDEGDATGQNLTVEQRRLAALAATEAARTAVAQARALEESRAHEAELDALAAEERELRLLEEAHARREMECVTTLRAGDCFGLLTVLERAPRCSTLVALDDTELACLSRTSYERIMRELNSLPRSSPKAPLQPRCNIPSLAKYLRLLRIPAEQREDSQLTYLAAPLLAHNRLLQQLDSRALMLLASGMKYLAIHKSGVVLARQGTEANWVYIVLQGSLSEHYLPPSPPTQTEVSFEGQSTTRSGEDTTRTGSASSHHAAAGQSTAAAPASAVGGISSDILSSYGVCSRILLTGDMSLFPDVDVGAPTFWANHRASYLTREPVVLAKISYDYLSHVLCGCNRPLKGVDAIRSALETPPGGGDRSPAQGGRSELQLDVLDGVLKNVTMFQFKPVKLRKQLCARMTLQRFGFDAPSEDPGLMMLMDPDAHARPTPAKDERQQTQVVFAQGQSSDAFYILLSGSVSIHQKLLDDSGEPAPHVKWDPNTALGAALPPFSGYDLLKTFGPCLSLGRAGSHFGDQALISTQARNLSILTRGPVEVAVVSRKDYNAVFIPIADELSYHASKALQLLSRPHRSPAIVAQLVETLKCIPYFSDMPVSLRSFAIRHMEVETIEGDTVVFAEDDAADCLYVVMAGSVGVHIQDKKAKEIAKAAKAESAEHAEAGAIVSEAVQEARDAEARLKMETVAAQIVCEGLQEEAAANSQEEQLAVQMRKDAAAEVKRLQREQKQRTGAGEDESATSSDSESSDDEDKPTAAAAAGAKGDAPLAASAAGRLFGSSRGDVFTASGAGQYALAQRLRSGSFAVIASGVAGGAAADGGKALAHLKKSGGMHSEADALRKKMQAAAAQSLEDDAAALVGEEGDAAATTDGAAADRPRTAGDKAPTGAPAPERMQVGHLSASERTEQFGPCVVQLPSGSVVGEVALTNANQKLLRTASIITMEPTFFVKLHASVVKRITFGGAAGSSGSSSGAAGGGTPGAGGLTQDQIANFLKELDALKVVKGSATGAGTGSHATFKRLAYHMKDRRLAPGYKIVEQGTRADSVFFIIQGSVLVQRHLLVTGLRPSGPSIPQSAAAEGSVTVGSDSIFVHPQRAGEPFQRVETTFIPPASKEEAGMIPPLPAAAPVVPAGAAVQGAEKVERPTSAGSMTAAAVAAAAAAASASRSSEIPPGLPPPAHGLPLHAELTVLGRGEQFGSLECLNGGLYSCTFVVCSSDCVILQMKRNHFLSLFPVRALDSLRDLGQQRSKVHAARASKFVAMRTGHMNLHPLVAALQNMVGSKGTIVHKESQQRQEEEEEHQNGEGEEQDSSVPPSLLALAGSTPAMAAKDPLRKKGLVHAHALRSPIAGNAAAQSSGQSGAASLMALASPGAAAVARKLRGEGEAQADAEAAALEGLGPLASSKSLIQQLLPVTSPLSANSVLATPPRNIASAATSPRAAAATPVSPAHSAQISAPPTPSFKPREHVLAPPSSRGPQLQSSSLMHSLQLVEQRTGTPLTPVQKALGLEGDPKEPLALTDRAFSWTPKMDPTQSGDRPSTAMTPTRRAVGEALMAPQRSPKNAAASTSRPSTTPTGRGQESPSGTAASPSLWPTDDQLPPSTQFAVSVVSADGGSARPASAASQKKRRGSIKVASLPSSSDDRHSSSLGSGVSYLPLAPTLHATAGQIAAFSATLTLPQSSGDIGVDAVSGSGPNGSFSARDRQLEEQLAGAITARQMAQAQNPHANKSNLPALAAPPSSAAEAHNITPRRGSMTQSEALLHALDGAKTSSSPVHSREPPASGQTSAQALAASASAAAVQSLDVESRALVLMRAEKLQMKWERDETQRRGHKIPEKVRPTSYNVSQELKQAQLSASLSWDQVHLNTESKTSNAFLHSASPPLAVMNVSLAAKEELMKRSKSLEAAADRAAGNFDEPQQQQEEQVLDPAMTDATIQALLARSEALTQSTSASAVAAAALSRGKAGRAFSAAKKDPADLVASASPIIRSLLHPLVETGFTSLFAAAPEGSHAHTPPVGAGSDGAALFSITSRVAAPGKLRKSMPSQLYRQQQHDGRPSTAGELGRTASLRSLGGSGPSSRVSTPARNANGGLRPSTSSASLGSSSLDLSTRELERQHPFLRFAQPVSAVQEVPLMDASPATLANRHRVSSAMARSASGSKLPRAHQQQQQRPSTSGGLRSSASAASLPRSHHDSGAASPVRGPRGGNVTPGAPSAQNFFASAPASAPGTMQKPPPALHVASIPGTPIATDALFSPSSSSSAVASPALTPLRHTRTSSLGSFMALSSAGVERKPSVVGFGSPHAHASMRGEAIAEEGGVTEEEEKQQTHTNSAYTSRRADLMSGLRRADGSRPSSANERPLVLGRAPSSVSSASSLLSPTASAAALSASSSAASASFPPSSDPGYATLGGSSHPSFRKTSYLDHRKEAASESRRIVLDAHQSVYSRAQHGAMLPGEKNLVAAGADGSDLSKEEAEAIRRKRMFGVVGPAHRGNQENPTGFSKVVAMSENLPGTLLAGRNAAGARKTRLEEEQAARAAKGDDFVASILQGFREATERTPQ